MPPVTPPPLLSASAMRAAASGVTAKVITLLDWWWRWSGWPLAAVPGAGTSVVPTASTGTCWYRVVS